MTKVGIHKPGMHYRARIHTHAHAHTRIMFSCRQQTHSGSRPLYNGVWDALKVRVNTMGMCFYAWMHVSMHVCVYMYVWSYVFTHRSNRAPLYTNMVAYVPIYQWALTARPFISALPRPLCRLVTDHLPHGGHEAGTVQVRKWSSDKPAQHSTQHSIHRCIHPKFIVVLLYT